MDGGSDAGMVIEGVDPPASPESVLPPAPPVFVPCPEGWREEPGTNGVVVCEPGTDVDACPHGQARFLTDGCASIGSECPEDGFPSDLPASGVVYVSSGGTGVGTRERPYGTIQRALAHRPAPLIVAVAVGVYDEAVVISRNVELRGACAAETFLHPSRASLGFASVEVHDSSATLRDFTIRGDRPGIRIEGSTTGAAASAHLEQLLIEEPHVIGVGVYNAGATLQRVVVRGTIPHPDGVARGINAEIAQVVIRNGVLERNHGLGINAINSDVELESVRVSGTLESGGFGDGVSASERSKIHGRDLLIDDSALLGMHVLQQGTSVELDQVVIRGSGGDGAQIGFGATARLSRVRFKDNADTGLLVNDTPGANPSTPAFRIENALAVGNGGRGFIVQDGANAHFSRVASDGNGGTAFLVASRASPSTLALMDAISLQSGDAGLMVQEGGRATVTRFETSGSHGTEITVRGDGTRLDAEDIYTHDSRIVPVEDPLEEQSRGLEVRVGASATVRRLRIERAHQLGIFVEDASVVLSDVHVSGTTARMDIVPAFGRGIEFAASTAELTRAVLERNLGAALVVSRGSTVTAADIVCAETGSSGIQLATGKGIAVNGGSSLTLTRAVVRDNREAALVAFEPGTMISASHVALLRTQQRECALTTCADFGFGVGVGAYLGSTIELSDFVIRSNHLLGAQIAEQGNLSLERGVIEGHPIGINVQVENYDFERLNREVELRDNERNLDTVSLPIPGAVEASTGDP